MGRTRAHPASIDARTSTLQAVLAGVALVVGLLVYVADRASSPPVAIPAFALLATGPLFGTLGQWLPSFVHPFAFSLLMAAAGPAGARPCYGACGFWWMVNVAFEAGQHPSLRAPLAEILATGLGDGPPGRWLPAYFLNGAFDVGDIAAATLGALAAAGVLRLFHRVEVPHAR